MVKNDPRKAGQFAGERERFGPFRRYAVAPVHTRFEAVQWFVWDAEAPTDDGLMAVIRQENTREDAMRGLTNDEETPTTVYERDMLLAQLGARVLEIHYEFVRQEGVRTEGRLAKFAQDIDAAARSLGLLDTGDTRRAQPETGLLGEEVKP